MTGLLGIHRCGGRTFFVTGVNGTEIDALSATDHSDQREECDSFGEDKRHSPIRLPPGGFGFVSTPVEYLARGKWQVTPPFIEPRGAGSYVEHRSAF